jgi:hypothetical protein
MLTAFIQWTTQLNAQDRITFALVVVLTMSLGGFIIGLCAEVLLKVLGARPGAARHPPRH